MGTYQTALKIMTDPALDREGLLMACALQFPEQLVIAAASLRTATPDVPQDILDAIKSGNKIKAIKEHRLTYGTGLKEAKEAIEHLIDVLGNPKQGALPITSDAFGTPSTVTW